MPSDLPFEKHERLLKKMAYQFHRRAMSAGATSLQLEDIYQEMCIAWCIARDKYDPATQIPFTAYLVRGVRNYVNRWVGKEIWHGQDKLDLDAQTGTENDQDAHAIIQDENSISPEVAAIENSFRAHLSSLSEEAQLFIALLENPPPHLFKVVDGYKMRRDYALKRGVMSGAQPEKISATLVFDLMGSDKKTRTRIYKEVQALANTEQLTNG